jgi:xanthine dehydrogenase accessory factor
MSDPLLRPAAPQPAAGESAAAQPAEQQPAARETAVASRLLRGPNAVTKGRAADLRAGRVAFVMATVVRAERPTSAKAGDVAVVLADGTVEGFVGGECAEASVRHQALEALEMGQPVLLRISPGAPPEATPAADRSRIPEGDEGVITVHNPCLSGGTLEIFLEPDLPPPVLIVHGASPIARALASLAEHLGYVVEHTGAGTATGVGAATEGPHSDAGFSGAAAVVVASHGRDEEAVLTAAVRADVGYIGLVASKKRGTAVLERLDVPAAYRATIHTPAGLDLGARKPQEIALSILAEIVSTRPKHAGGPEGGTGVVPVAAVASAVDPVCGMTVAVGASTPTAEHATEPYFFCGLGCRDAFVADPAGFLGRR